MKLTCECGHEFEAPDGTQSAPCPACGRQVAAGDWLASLDAEDLSLDAEAPAADESAAEPAPPPKPPTPARSVPLGSRPMPAPPEQAEIVVPRDLFQLAGLIRSEPWQVMGLFRRGIRGGRFMVELGVAYAALACLWAPTAAGLAGKLKAGAVAGNFLRLLVELVAATIILVLLAVLLKREPAERPDPLGVAEGMALTRLLGLAVAVPLGLSMAWLVWASGGVEGAPHYLVFLAAHVGTVYRVIVFAAQTGFVMGLLNLGCLPGVVLSVVAGFGGSSMAGWLF